MLTEPTYNRTKISAVMSFKAYREMNHVYLEYMQDRYTNLPYVTEIHKLKKWGRPSNIIEDLIQYYIKWTGGFCENVKNQGTYRPGIGYTYGRGTKGTADLHAMIGGKTVKIEVKYGKDKQSEAQKEYQARIERAGGEYWIVHTFDEFLAKMQT